MQEDGTNEKNRKINNLGDELSDVILQLIALSDLIKINLYNLGAKIRPKSPNKTGAAISAAVLAAKEKRIIKGLIR